MDNGVSGSSVNNSVSGSPKANRRAVHLSLDPYIHGLYLQMAAKESRVGKRVYVQDLVGEALITWIKWMRKAEKLEQKELKASGNIIDMQEEEMDEEIHQINEAMKLHKEYINSRR